MNYFSVRFVSRFVYDSSTISFPFPYSIREATCGYRCCEGIGTN